MTDRFDPYRKWLGIRSPDRPPNHYCLLGLEAFEDDADVISAAADRQMTHVRTYQSGPHAALSQKLLNELAAAKLCLLQDDKKRAYDAALQKRLQALPRATPVRQWQPPKHHITPGERLARQMERASQRRSWRGWALSTAAMLVLIAVVSLGTYLYENRQPLVLGIPEATLGTDTTNPVTGSDNTLVLDEPIQPPHGVGTGESDSTGDSEPTVPASNATDPGRASSGRTDDRRAVEPGDAVRNVLEQDSAELPEQPVDEMPLPPEDVTGTAESAVPSSGTGEAETTDGSPNTTVADSGAAEAELFDRLLQAIAERDIETARRYRDEHRDMRPTGWPLATDRLSQLTQAFDQWIQFWDTVELALRQLSPARPLRYRDREATLVQYSAQAVTLRFADGQQREFPTGRQQIDRDLAIALVEYQLANRRPVADQLIAVFLELDREGDRELSKIYRDRAAAAGRPTFLVHVSGQQPDGIAPANPARDPRPQSATVATSPNGTVMELLQTAGQERHVIPPANELEQRQHELRVALAPLFHFPATDTAAAQRLLRELWDTAQQTHGDPLIRLVSAREAAKVAAALGDVAFCQKAVDLIGSEFDVSCAAEFEPYQTAVLHRSRSRRVFELVAMASLEFADRSVLEGDYDGAIRLLSSLITSLRGRADGNLIRFCNERRSELGVLVRQHRAMLRFAEDAGETPASPEQKARVGEYFCFVRGDVVRGLPLLAAGPASELQELAAGTLQAREAASAKTLLQLADRWWVYAESRKGAAQRYARGQANGLYEQAIQGIRGVDEAHVRNRLAEYRKLYRVPPPTGRGAP